MQRVGVVCVSECVGGCWMKESSAAVLHYAAVRQQLVTVSDKYRGLQSSALQLYLCWLLKGRERPRHLGDATILIHPH